MLVLCISSSASSPSVGMGDDLQLRSNSASAAAAAALHFKVALPCTNATLFQELWDASSQINEERPLNDRFMTFNKSFCSFWGVSVIMVDVCAVKNMQMLKNPVGGFWLESLFSEMTCDCTTLRHVTRWSLFDVRSSSTASAFMSWLFDLLRPPRGTPQEAYTKLDLFP